MKKSQLVPAALTATTLLVFSLTAGIAEAGRNHNNLSVAGTHEDCGRALIASQQQVLRREAALLARCARTISDQHTNRIVEYRCGRLQRAGVGADRIERIARSRVESLCSTTSLPAWFATTCSASGPERGTLVTEPSDAAACVLSSGRCMALAATEELFRGMNEMLSLQVPGVLDFELGGIAGQTFGACEMAAVPTTTTTTTLAAPSTTTTTTTSTTTLTDPTTTTLPPPTTTTTSTTLPAPEAPSIVVAEIMADPAAQSDTAGEYFEIVNTGAAAHDLQGMTFHDLGSNTFTVTDSLLVPAGGRAVLGRSSSAAGGAIDYVYGSAMSLGNSSDEIIVERDGVVIDEVAWDASFPLLAGAAMELLLPATGSMTNDDPAAWCASASPLGDGDFGTPGSAPGACSELP